MQTGKKIGAWPDPKDQRPHSSQGDHNFCLHGQIGHQGMWSFGSTGGCSLYQQANNFWLRKLAHVRELYLIPTGDTALVVFAMELLSQLRNRDIDLDRVSQIRARQDGKHLDKYAAQMVAEHIQGWIPMSQ